MNTFKADIEEIRRRARDKMEDGAVTGSYQAAFLNGIAWNLLNMSIACWLLVGRMRARTAPA